MGETISVAAGTSLKEHFARNSGGLGVSDPSSCFLSFFSDGAPFGNCSAEATATEGVTPLLSRLVSGRAELALAPRFLLALGRKSQHLALRGWEETVAGISLDEDGVGTAAFAADCEGGRGIAFVYPLAAV